MSRILITGASGYLGHTLTNILSCTHEIYAGHRTSSVARMPGTGLRFDITKQDEVRQAFETARPDCVVHTAGLTRPDYCELHPAETHAVNVEASRFIAKQCREFRARLVYISTDLVFDGMKGEYTEDDLPVGINEYARSKIQAESMVHLENPGTVILRVSVLYGPGGGPHTGFLDEVMSRWRNGETMTFFTDQFRSPTFTPQVADAVQGFISHSEVAGIFHLGGGDRLSRYQFGSLVAKAVGAPQSFVRQGSMKDYAGPAKRATDCSLVSEKIRKTLGLRPMPCETGLMELVKSGALQPIV